MNTWSKESQGSYFNINYIMCAIYVLATLSRKLTTGTEKITLIQVIQFQNNCQSLKNNQFFFEENSHKCRSAIILL